MNKLFNIVIATLIIGFGAFATLSIIQAQKDTVSVKEYDYNQVINGNKDNGGIADHVFGNKDAKIKIFEYSDFECGYCAKVLPEVKKLIAEYGDKIAVVYRNTILSFHKSSNAATSAAEAAGLQGFWEEYMALLFNNQSMWSDASVDARTKAFVTLFEKASNGKGDINKFKEDINSKSVKRKIAFDGKISDAVQVPGTPSFYLDGKYVQMKKSGLDTLRELINEKLGSEAPDNIKKTDTSNNSASASTDNSNTTPGEDAE